GTVSFTLYGSNTLGNSNAGDCTDLPPASLGTKVLNGSAVADGSSATAPLHAGKFGFKASYPGDADYNATTSACETVTVNQADLASFTTAIHLGADHSTNYDLGSVALGSTPHDSATATGNGLTGFTPTGTVGFTLYGSNTLGNSNVGN